MASPPEDEKMRLVPQEPAAPPIHSVAPRAPAEDLPVYYGKARLKGTGIFSNNPAVIFGGLIVAGTLALLIYFGVRDANEKRRVEKLRATSEAMTTDSAGLIKVSAIALGQPKLAVVNGRQVAEGDSLPIRSGKGVSALRVSKIVDGAVEFSDGKNTIRAQLGVPVSPNKPNP